MPRQASPAPVDDQLGAFVDSRRWVGEQRPLGEAQVRLADSGESAGEPWFAPKPSYRVGSVFDLVAGRHELAARAECASYALHYDVISTFGVHPSIEPRQRCVASVRAAQE